MNLSQNVIVVYYFNEDTISCMLWVFPSWNPKFDFLLEQTDEFFTSDELMYPQNKHFILIAKTWLSDAHADIVELFIAQLSRFDYFWFHIRDSLKPMFFLSLALSDNFRAEKDVLSYLRSKKIE